MRHRIGYKPLGRKASHRKALHRNLAISLFRYERVKTTRQKARDIRRTAEKMITRAKVDSVHNRRILRKSIHDPEILAKLFTDIAPRFAERPGGYTRILKLGRRQGDAAEMVILELVERKEIVREKPKASPKVEKEPEAEKKPKVEKEPEAEKKPKAEKEPEAEKKPKAEKKPETEPEQADAPVEEEAVESK
jgi:large subunit ribosomal protein L17